MKNPRSIFVPGDKVSIVGNKYTHLRTRGKNDIGNYGVVIAIAETGSPPTRVKCCNGTDWYYEDDELVLTIFDISSLDDLLTW